MEKEKYTKVQSISVRVVDIKLADRLRKNPERILEELEPMIKKRQDKEKTDKIELNKRKGFEYMGEVRCAY